jgi:hypothetical protein
MAHLSLPHPSPTERCRVQKYSKPLRQLVCHTEHVQSLSSTEVDGEECTCLTSVLCMYVHYTLMLQVTRYDETSLERILSPDPKQSNSTRQFPHPTQKNCLLEKFVIKFNWLRYNELCISFPGFDRRCLGTKVSIRSIKEYTLIQGVCCAEHVHR